MVLCNKSHQFVITRASILLLLLPVVEIASAAREIKDYPVLTIRFQTTTLTLGLRPPSKDNRMWKEALDSSKNKIGTTTAARQASLRAVSEHNSTNALFSYPKKDQINYPITALVCFNQFA